MDSVVDTDTLRVVSPGALDDLQAARIVKFNSPENPDRIIAYPSPADFRRFFLNPPDLLLAVQPSSLPPASRAFSLPSLDLQLSRRFRSRF